MTWFKTDDGWHKHRRRIRVGLDMEGYAAQGLWCAAGSWCADELTDGWVPDYMLDYLAPGLGRELAKKLVSAGLWEPGIRDGESGHQFNRWTKHQPTRDEVMALRDKKADGGKIGNHRRWHTGKGVTDPRCPYCRTTESVPTRTTNHTPDRSTDRTTDFPGTSDLSTDHTSDRSSDRSTDRRSKSGPNPPVPSRPDPSRPDESQNLLPAATRQAGHDDPADADTIPGTSLAVVEGSNPAPKTRRGTRLPEQWQPSADSRTWFGETYAERVDVRTEHTKFVNYWLAKSGRDATKLDWDRTWRNWMITAAERAGTRPTVTALDDGRAVHRKTSSHLDHMSAYGDPDA